VRILSIESSCDETSAAVVQDGTQVLSNIIASSREVFTNSGGVIPEDAARRQVECILPVIHQAMEKANVTKETIDAIAVTRGPGLLGSLLVGTTAARAIAHIWNKPIIGVHHTLGHLSSTWLGADSTLVFPMLTLSASGGHTDLWLRTSHTAGTLLGRTRDDAAGEAFDKGASLLGLPYPGGPSISKAAAGGRTDAYDFPLPLKKEDTLDFSFSGLKTSLLYTIRDGKIRNSKFEILNLSDLAASYQYALCLHLLDRIAGAIIKHPEVKEIHVVGGVSANTQLRSMLPSIAGERTVRFPKNLAYCTDNAAMIAAAAEFLMQEKGDGATERFTTEATLGLENAIEVRQ
jgi:N6-L-threonylcarbamoyladenine synthase